MAAPRSRQQGTITRRLPLVQGAIAGGLAFVAGVVLTYLFVLVDSDLGEEVSDTADNLEEFGAGTLDVVGWIYYNAHFVETETTTEFAGESRSDTESFLSEASSTFPEFVYYLLPAVVLVGAGYYVARQSGAGPNDQSIVTGATVILGYLPLALLGTALFRVSDSMEVASVTVEPELVPALFFAGILYPLVLGGVGGLLARVTADTRQTRL